jgi:serine/threonine-protein kinase
VASEVPPPQDPDFESAGSPPRADAFERLGILETLSYGIVYDGRVYRASRSEPLTLLELNPAFAAAENDLLGRLSAEIETASNLKDANILTPRGLYRSGEDLYVLYDAVPGVSLSTAFQILAISSLRLSAEAILRIAGAVLAALDQAAAAGRDDAFHGFLTPENIFIAEGQRVLVRGFGLWPGGIGRLKLVRPSEARYLTPSQNRAEAASARADLFSLGTILFEAVSGVAAFDGPPDEEAVMSLKDSVEESKNQGGPSLQALYSVIGSCLSANSPIPAFRGRLRTSVDTLFLSELAHDKAPKTLSLEELLGRVRAKKPAVIKAKSLNLVRLEKEEPAVAPPPVLPRLPDPVALPADGEVDSSPPQAVRMTKAPAPRFPSDPAPKTERRAPALPSIWLIAVILVVGGIFAVLFLSMRSHRESESSRTAVVTIPSPVESSWPPPAVATVIAPTPEVPASQAPTPAPTTAPLPTAPPPTRSKFALFRKRPPAPTPKAPRGNVEHYVPSVPASASGAGDAAAPSAAAPVPVSISAGSLVPLETAGLVRPVLTSAGDTPRFGSGRLVQKSAFLQVLVDDRGRVRANRVLRAEQMPPGFAQEVERYLSTLRFQPGQVGTVPVRVWIPYELRFFAP